MFGEQDYLMRQINDFSRALGKTLFNKSVPSEEIVNPDGSISEEAMNKAILLKKIEDGKLNEAENFLFDVLNKSDDPAMLEVGVWFYAQLNKQSDKQLEQAEFSREEIADGLNEIKAMLAKYDSFYETISKENAEK